MQFPANIFARFNLSSRRYRRWMFSTIFGLFVIGVFYIIRWVVPPNLLLYNQIVTILFIVIAVLLLFPAREKILHFLLGKTEFTQFFGRDYHHLDFIAQQFTTDALVQEVFPEFMQWMGVRHARLAVLEPGRRQYRFHVYRNGRLLKSRNSYARRPSDPLLKELRNFKDTVDIQMTGLSRAVRERMEALGAAQIHPFVFRNRLLGFLIMHEPPRNKHARRALEFFGDKAAVSIQNDIFTYRIIDSRLYDREISAAQRVQSIFHNAPAPTIPGYALRRPEQKDFASIVEFFRAGDHRWFIVVLSSDRLTSSAGILLYGIFGRLYSFIHRERAITMHKLMANLKKGLADRSEYDFEILLAELLAEDRTLVVLMEGSGYEVVEISQPSHNIVSRGWRNFIELKEDRTYRFFYNQRPLLELGRSSPQNARSQTEEELLEDAFLDQPLDEPADGAR